MSRRANLLGYLFVLPAFTFFALFRLIPYLQTFWFGFHDWNGVAAPTWVGLQNYVEALQDERFWRAAWNTLLFMAIDMVLPLSIGFILAVLVAQVRRGRTVFRVGLFLPFVLSGATVSVLWSQIYNPNVGIVNVALRAVGLDGWANSWLGESQFALPAVGIAHGWNVYGFAFVVFLAAIQSIDPLLYDAARIDGANRVQVVRHVTIPGVGNATTLLYAMAFLEAISAFTFIFLMTKGGPNFSTEVLSTYIYDKAFQATRFGYASALSAAMALIALFGAVLFIRLRERGD